MKSLFQGRGLSLLLGTLLVLVTFGAYFGVWKNEFVDFDDQHYVFANRWVMSGLSWPTVVWAFTQVHTQNWHPLTWLSHALDVQIYGLNAGGHHVTNLLFHLANTILVFVVLRRMTGSMWRSALVAALFGVHPLHVESVAWVSERKDVLSGFFFLLTLLTYNRYVTQRRRDANLTTENTKNTEGVAKGTTGPSDNRTIGQGEAKGTIGPSDNRTIGQGQTNTEGSPDDQSSKFDVQRSPSPPPQSQSPKSSVPSPKSHRPMVPWSYCLALAFFALGLMSKPMLVTVPFVLLLLDWWPLGRFEATGKNFTRTLLGLTREKIPFFILTAVSSIITMNAQSGAMSTTQMLPMEYRLPNAVRSYCVYLAQTFWPKNLTAFYPHERFAPNQAEFAAVILVLITLGSLLYARRAGFFSTGWLWYLGMLVPVIGIVQVGSQAHADRYTYLPHLGVFIACAWTLEKLIHGRKALGYATGAALAGVVLVLAGLTYSQAQVWRNTTTLFQHGVKVNPKNFLARSILAQKDMDAGKLDEAIQELQSILRGAPNYPFAELLLATCFQMQGRMEEAIPHLLAIRNAPDHVSARNARLVLSYLYVGNLEAADATLNELMQLNPSDPAVFWMGAAIQRQRGNVEQAADMFRMLSKNGPPPKADNPALNFEVAELYAILGDQKTAAPFYQEAISLAPTYTNALNNYAWLLATSTSAELRDGKKAVQMAEKACELSQWKVPIMVGTLAAAYAEAGRFEDAVKTGEKARDLARAQGMEDVAKRNEELLALYRDKKPYRE